jgi:hypothetical protein
MLLRTVDLLVIRCYCFERGHRVNYKTITIFGEDA